MGTWTGADEGEWIKKKGGSGLLETRSYKARALDRTTRGRVECAREIV